MNLLFGLYGASYRIDVGTEFQGTWHSARRSHADEHSVGDGGSGGCRLLPALFPGAVQRIEARLGRLLDKAPTRRPRTDRHRVAQRRKGDARRLNWLDQCNGTNNLSIFEKGSKTCRSRKSPPNSWQSFFTIITRRWRLISAEPDNASPRYGSKCRSRRRAEW